jgi:hypothetical protein
MSVQAMLYSRRGSSKTTAKKRRSRSRRCSGGTSLPFAPSRPPAAKVPVHHPCPVRLLLLSGLKKVCGHAVRGVLAAVLIMKMLTLVDGSHRHPNVCSLLHQSTPWAIHTILPAQCVILRSGVASGGSILRCLRDSHRYTTHTPTSTV